MNRKQSQEEGKAGRRVDEKKDGRKGTQWTEAIP